MVEFTKEFDEWNDKYKEKFGEWVPMMMIPQVETTEGLIDKIKQSLAAGKNLLPEFYDWKYDGSVLY